MDFILSDIGNQPGPSLEKFQTKILQPELQQQQKNLQQQINAQQNQINEATEEQRLIQNSVNSYHDTLNQLLDLKKLGLEKGMAQSQNADQNLQNMTQLYLQQQQQYQELNKEITHKKNSMQDKAKELNTVNEQLHQQQEKAYKLYQKEFEKFRWYLAFLQLLVLIPLLLLSVFFLRRAKNDLYKPLWVAITIALFSKAVVVMHEYFPSYLFRYLLVLVLIFVTGRFLIARLKLATTAHNPWLQKQYREAYQKNHCPSCQFAIKPGTSGKFLFSEQLTNTPCLEEISAINQYTCPACGERLFAPCTKCGQIRYSLLPYCDHCGHFEKTLQE